MLSMLHLHISYACVHTYSVESGYEVNWGSTPVFHTKQVFHAKQELVVTMGPQQGS